MVLRSIGVQEAAFVDMQQGVCLFVLRFMSSQHSSQKGGLSSMAAASSHMTADGGLYIKTRFLLHRDRAGQLWRLRELHETTWDVTEIWIRCGEGDLGLGPPDVPEVRPAPSIPPPTPASLTLLPQ